MYRVDGKIRALGSLCVLAMIVGGCGTSASSSDTASTPIVNVQALTGVFQSPAASSDAVVQIKDQGRGMPRKIQQFVHSRRMSPNIRVRRNLGLALVKGIVAVHGGRIKVVSASRKGTIVEVRIPLKGAQP